MRVLKLVNILNWSLLALLLVQFIQAEPDVNANTLDDVTTSHKVLSDTVAKYRSEETVLVKNQTEDTDIAKNRTDDTNTPLVLDTGRQMFTGVLDTISGFGPIGLQLSNFLRAIFFEPPLGPYFCFLFGTCRNRAEELDGRYLSMTFEEMGSVMKSLWGAYEKYKSPAAAPAA